jgi:hypothetical protein
LNQGYGSICDHLSLHRDASPRSLHWGALTLRATFAAAANTCTSTVYHRCGCYMHFRFWQIFRRCSISTADTAFASRAAGAWRGRRALGYHCLVDFDQQPICSGRLCDRTSICSSPDDANHDEFFRLLLSQNRSFTTTRRPSSIQLPDYLGRAAARDQFEACQPLVGADGSDGSQGPALQQAEQSNLVGNGN